MELEFDKEIDAILRKGREAGGLGAPISAHLDADTIAAFAENALPQKAKLLYTEHFADCDGCRKQLAFTVQMGGEPVATASAAAPVLEAAIPGYQRLFKTPNMALAMGALVLTFGGVLGYMVLQNSQRDQNSTVTQVTEQEQQPGGPSFDGELEMSNTNAATPLANAATTANSNSNMTAPTSRLSGNTANTTAPPEEAPVTMAAPADGGAKPQPFRESQPPAKPETAAPPPPATMDSVAHEAEKKSDDDKAKDEKDLSMRKRNEGRRDASPPAAKMGPTRSGPLQNQSNNSLYQMSVTRTAGGKTFTNRDGAWYDTAYRGQSTQNYRRGTEEYKKLDKGLRSIADTIGGTVVVVWKEKAYRIS